MIDEAVKRFLRSQQAAAFLWPHVPPEQREGIIESVLEEFEQ